MTKIRALRISRGLSQEGMARLVGVTRDAARQWELGTYKPTEENARRLARALGVTVEDLRDEVPEQ